MRHASMFAFAGLLCSCASAPPAASASGTSGASGDERGTARAQLEDLRKAAGAFELSMGRCPWSVEELVHAPSGESFIASVPNDPWGQPLAFMPAGEENPRAAFVSGGPDGSLLTDDDITVSVTCSGR